MIFDLTSQALWWSVDFGTQPVNEHDFRVRVDQIAAIHTPFVLVAYASSPGIGKGRSPRINVPNGSGAPYRDLHKQKRNHPYWEEFYRRCDYIMEKGGSFVSGNTFRDCGVFEQRVVDQEALVDEMVRIANELKPYRCIHNTIGEADEARPARVPEKMYEILREVRKIVRPAPVGYHSINDNSRDADHLDFISAQEHRGHIDWNGFLRLKDKFEMPVLVLEDQDSTEDQIIHNLKESLRLGIVYTVTGKNLHTTPQFEQRIKDVFAGIA